VHEVENVALTLSTESPVPGTENKPETTI
jgi:hypothetical protein